MRQFISPLSITNVESVMRPSNIKFTSESILPSNISKEARIWSRIMLYLYQNLIRMYQWDNLVPGHKICLQCFFIIEKYYSFWIEIQNRIWIQTWTVFCLGLGNMVEPVYYVYLMVGFCAHTVTQCTQTGGLTKSTPIQFIRPSPSTSSVEFAVWPSNIKSISENISPPNTSKEAKIWSRIMH